jgi:hypothetical protein
MATIPHFVTILIPVSLTHFAIQLRVVREVF